MLFAYIAFFSIVLLQINTFAFEYIENGKLYLYIVLAEHFVAALLFGFFWVTLTGIKIKYAVISSLILPTVFFSIILIDIYTSETTEEDAMTVFTLLAIVQYIGIILGSIYFISKKRHNKSLNQIAANNAPPG